jgi:mRNA interferase RelE/StbE
MEHAAEKKLRQVDKDFIPRIVSAAYALADDPRPPGCLMLKDSKHAGWRIHVGKYRVLYRIDDEQREVAVFDIELRDRVYRRNRRRF